jgi:adenosylhomocysteine nucleosidase
VGIEGNLSGKRTRFVTNGPGMQNARAAVEQVFQAEAPSAVISVGCVGALDPALEVGQIFLARQVKRMGETVDYQGELPAFPNTEGVAQGTLLTIDRVAQTRQEKAHLRQSGADVVDMEAYAVADEAAKRAVPFYCVRVVSDHANTDFPVDFNRARRPDGTFSGWKLAAQAGLNPRRWQRLLDLKRDADLASRRLAEFLKTCQFP